MEWIGGTFNPEAFDVARANVAIHGGRVRRKQQHSKGKKF